MGNDLKSSICLWNTKNNRTGLNDNRDNRDFKLLTSIIDFDCRFWARISAFFRLATKRCTLSVTVINGTQWKINQLAESKFRFPYVAIHRSTNFMFFLLDEIVTTKLLSPLIQYTICLVYSFFLIIIIYTSIIYHCNLTLYFNI